MSERVKVYHKYNSTGKKQKELTEEQMQELKDQFDDHDDDGSGSLDDREVKKVMRGMGFADLSKEAVQSLINEVDADASGVIEFPEFLELMTLVILERDPSKEISKAFDLFTAGDLITFNDLRRLANEVNEPFSDEELQDMIDEGDRSGKGGLDPTDFVRVMRKTGLFWCRCSAGCSGGNPITQRRVKMDHECHMPLLAQTLLTIGFGTEFYMVARSIHLYMMFSFGNGNLEGKCGVYGRLLPEWPH